MHVMKKKMTYLSRIMTRRMNITETSIQNNRVRKKQLNRK